MSADQHDIDSAIEAITSDARECEKFANELLDCYRDQLAELMTGAYGYANEEATRRFRSILHACQLRLVDRAERNLQTMGF